MSTTADVACASIEEVERELRELADSGHSLVVHLTWSASDRAAISYCSKEHGHIVMELSGDGWGSRWRHEVLVEAIINEHERSLLAEMQKPMHCPGMNSRDERIRNLTTRIAGVQVRVRQWAEVSNFNGGYDVGGTDYELLVN